MPFIGRKHVSYRIRAMLLDDKLNAFINRENVFCRQKPNKQLTVNKLQKRLILAVFRTEFGFAGEEGQNEPGFFPFPGGFRLKVDYLA